MPIYLFLHRVVRSKAVYNLRIRSLPCGLDFLCLTLHWLRGVLDWYWDRDWIILQSGIGISESLGIRLTCFGIGLGSDLYPGPQNGCVGVRGTDGV